MNSGIEPMTTTKIDAYHCAPSTVLGSENTSGAHTHTHIHTESVTRDPHKIACLFQANTFMDEV